MQIVTCVIFQEGCCADFCTINRKQLAFARENTTIRVLSICNILLLLNGRNDLTALLMQRIAGN